MTYRILQLTSTSDIGGTESMLLHFLQHASRSRFSLEVGSLTGSGLLTERARALGVPAWNLAMRSPVSPGPGIHLFNLLRRGRFDLVQLYGLRADTLARPLARLAGIPVIVSSIRSTDPWRKRRHVWLDRLTAPLAALWISNSEAGRRSRIERERFAAEKIITILNGIPLPPPELAAPPTPEERRAFDEEAGLDPADGPRVAFVANLRRMKGHEDLVEALPAVLEKFPKLKVLCAGRDDSLGAIPALARARGVDHALRLLGFRADTQRIVRHCDWLILPSLWEGCPVSVMEAMALGRPVIATRVGGIPELLESGREGLLIQPHAPAELAQALTALAGDPARVHAMGEAARRRAEAEFSVETMTRRLEAVYLKLLEKNQEAE